MDKNTIACCYFPTTVLFLDDKIDELTGIKISLQRNLVCKLYRDPLTALRYLTNEYQPKPFFKRWVSNLKDIDRENDPTHSYIDIDLYAIHREIYATDRFEEISVVIVDYDMPKMNGLEFCKKIKNSSIKKLMLTGVADESLAVRAFNEGIIDHFVGKGERNFTEHLNKAIAELQYAYFHDLSSMISKNIGSNPYSCLSDPEFIKFFANIRQERSIVEYYLVNDSGCFLLLDINGNPSWLVMKSEEHMKHYWQTAKDNGAPRNIVNALDKREKVLFLFSEEDEYCVPASGWARYMYPAAQFIGKCNNYFYAIIEGSAVYDINTDKIASYRSYLESFQFLSQRVG